ncbi:uncharacterized protein [Dermacentor albipictus]|uniref:uncharacterized protein n=1 Tax=Dermacentor albipictus TaxID=60249 RepID=UPI0038FC949C
MCTGFKLSSSDFASSPTFLSGERRHQVPNKQGSNVIVDLEEEATNFIQKLNETTGNIISWGLTSKYGYWSSNETKKYTVKALVNGMKCENGVNDRVPPNIARKLFVWNITHGISSPLRLTTMVTVPMIREKGVPGTKITIDVNKKTKIILSKKVSLKKASNEVVERWSQSCPFIASVSFDGWFAYETTDVRNGPENGTKYKTVGVGSLRNPSKGLINASDHILTYTLRGIFWQQFWWRREQATYKHYLIG